jgi:hypothetical protein
MARFMDTKSNRSLSAKLTAGILLSGMFAFGAFAGSANADDHGRWNRGNDRNWSGGYYRAPPVVYGSPYGTSYYGTPYYAPPVVYGPAPGLSINIR